jgi:hypothetical protein
VETFSMFLLVVSPSTLESPYLLLYAAKSGFADYRISGANLALRSCRSSALNWAAIKTRNPVQ